MLDLDSVVIVTSLSADSSRYEADVRRFVVGGSGGGLATGVTVTVDVDVVERSLAWSQGARSLEESTRTLDHVSPGDFAWLTTFAAGGCAGWQCQLASSCVNHASVGSHHIPQMSSPLGRVSACPCMRKICQMGSIPVLLAHNGRWTPLLGLDVLGTP
jgi:hypothetical protein